MTAKSSYGLYLTALVLEENGPNILPVSESKFLGKRLTDPVWYPLLDRPTVAAVQGRVILLKDNYLETI